MGRVPLAAALAACLWASAAAQEPAAPEAVPQADPAPRRVLFVGNSYFYYNDSLHNHVGRLARSLDPRLAGELEYKSATIGGASLDQHPIERHLRHERLGVGGPFELVILQGGSAEPLSERRRRRFIDTVREFDRIIRAAGAETALYMTHAYAPPHPRHDPDMIRAVESLYVEAADQVGALVIPVGLAFEEAYRRRPRIALHKAFDGSHPDMLGTYLAACVVYASVYGGSPVGSDYDYFGRVSPADARFLQTVAWDVVSAFRARR